MTLNLSLYYQIFEFDTNIIQILVWLLVTLYTEKENFWSKVRSLAKLECQHWATGIYFTITWDTYWTMTEYEYEWHLALAPALMHTWYMPDTVIFLSISFSGGFRGAHPARAPPPPFWDFFLQLPPPLFVHVRPLLKPKKKKKHKCVGTQNSEMFRIPPHPFGTCATLDAGGAPRKKKCQSPLLCPLSLTFLFGFFSISPWLKKIRIKKSKKPREVTLQTDSIGLGQAGPGPGTNNIWFPNRSAMARVLSLWRSIEKKGSESETSRQSRV